MQTKLFIESPILKNKHWAFCYSMADSREYFSTSFLRISQSPALPAPPGYISSSSLKFFVATLQSRTTTTLLLIFLEAHCFLSKAVFAFVCVTASLNQLTGKAKIKPSASRRGPLVI
jgi:hypothetical protein